MKWQRGLNRCTIPQALMSLVRPWQRRVLLGGGVAKRATWRYFSFWRGGWFSFSSSETRIRCRRSCHKGQGDTTRRPAQAVGVRSGGGRLEEGACGGASGENRWSVGRVGGREGGIRPGRRPVIQDCGGQAPARAKPLRQTLAQGETKGLSRGNWLAPSMGRAIRNPLGSGGGGCLGGNGDVRGLVG